jgi:hypothetical protein
MQVSGFLMQVSALTLQESGIGSCKSTSGLVEKVRRCIAIYYQFEMRGEEEDYYEELKSGAVLAESHKIRRVHGLLTCKVKV